MLLSLYHLWNKALRQLRSFSMHSRCKAVQLLVHWVNHGLCQLCLVTKFNLKLNLKTKIQLFGLWKRTYRTIFIYAKLFIIEISYKFLYVWICIELYDNKFLNYRKCMIRIFGQPGDFCGPLLKHNWFPCCLQTTMWHKKSISIKCFYHIWK